MGRTNFTTAQKAEIYCLDRATCAYTGRSLWVMDYGFDPETEIDWADHVVPASRGGASDIENGTAATWYANKSRGNSMLANPLFHRGVPTGKRVNKAIAANLIRFAALHPSDWLLNRGLWHLLLACIVEIEASNGVKRKRRRKYYTAAAFKSFAKWRRQRDLHHVPTPEARGLIPARLHQNTAALYSARNITSRRKLAALVTDLLSRASRNRKWRW